MKWTYSLAGILFFILISSPNLGAGETVRVVTTIPILEDLVNQIGGQEVSTQSLLTGMESPHTYGPKPSDLATLQKAQIFIKIGAGLEGWVENMLKSSHNPDLLLVNTSKNVPLLESENSHHAGSDHHVRNPHIWLDPQNVKMMLIQITAALITVSPEKKNIFQKNQDQYFKKLDALETEIHRLFEGISNKKIISYHPAWPYFSERFGIIIAADIQKQIGTEPSVKHLSQLIRLIKEQNIKVIVSEPQLNPKIPNTLAQETEARVITLTSLPGGLPNTENYLSMMRYNAITLSKALRGE